MQHFIIYSMVSIVFFKANNLFYIPMHSNNTLLSQAQLRTYYLQLLIRTGRFLNSQIVPFGPIFVLKVVVVCVFFCLVSLSLSRLLLFYIIIFIKKKFFCSII